MENSKKNIVELDDHKMLTSLRSALQSENIKTVARAKELMGKMRSAVASQAPDLQKLTDSQLLDTLLQTTVSKNERIFARGKMLVELARESMKSLFEKEKVHLDPRLLNISSEESDITGLIEFKEKLGKIAQNEALPVLEYLDSDDWMEGVKKRKLLKFKIVTVYLRFWETLGTKFQDEHPDEFTILSTALKKLLAFVELETYQEKPGKMEKDVEWYRANPPATFYRNSKVKTVLIPGVMQKNGENRESRALVTFDTSHFY